MKLSDPIIITARLLPGLRVGDSTLSITYAQRPGREGRVRYQYYLDLPHRQEFGGDDLQSGAGGGNLYEGLSSLLSFLQAAGEAYRAQLDGHRSENSDLFNEEVAAWAYLHQAELEGAALDLEANPGAIEE